MHEAGGLYLGLDVGTQGTKGVVLDAASGEVVARAGVSYGLIEDLAPGAAEQHPETWIDAVRQVCSALWSSGVVDPGRVRGVGVSGQQHGLVVLDECDEVVRPAKLWCDTSTAAEARELSGWYGRPVPAGFTVSKILWIQRHEPAAWARVRSILLPHDYVNFRLTGTRTMEAGDASGTGFFDVHRRAFHLGEVKRLGDAVPGMLPDLTRAGELAGRLSGQGAGLTGLPEGTPVAAGGGDNMMSAIGSGATRSGVVVMSLGTSGTVFTCTDHPVVDPEGLIAPFCDSTGKWLPLLCVMNATGVTEEVCAGFGGLSLEEMTARAREVPAGCKGVMFLPYLQGERVPDLPDATGAILGLRPGLLDPAVLFRAALEGTSLGLGWGVERMRGLGVRIESVRLVGGGSRNALWRRILAGVLGVPVTGLMEPESAALGGAIQAFWTVCRMNGEAMSMDEVTGTLIQTEGETVEPEETGVAIYRDLLERFKNRVGALFGACREE